MYKNIFLSTAESFTKLTGVKVEYRNQGSNGKYLFFNTSDNNGEGVYIEINNFLEGLKILENMENGYILAKKGKFL